MSSRKDIRQEFFKNEGILSLYAQRFDFNHPSNPKENDPLLFYDLRPSGHPIFIHTHELRSNRVHRANIVQPLGGIGLRLDGRNQLVGVFDQGRIQIEHQEFQSRVRMRDNAMVNNFHATHVTGIIAAAGINPEAKGKAPRVRIDGYSFDNWDRKLIDAVEEGLAVSNHSYGPATGWLRDDNFQFRWRWFGDTTVSSTVDYEFGFYSAWSRFHDALNYFFPYHSMVTSAGNSRNIFGPGPPYTHEILRNGQWVRSNTQRDPNGPYDSMPTSATGKNIISVGAVSATTPQNFTMASFSSWGPTDDGRVKPDLVGVGVNVLSTLENQGTAQNRYGTLQGTSMSSPNVAGGITLLRQHFMQQHNYMPLASTLKALAIHSARQPSDTDPGPNYRFGWGLMDVEASANHVTLLDSVSYIIYEDAMENGDVFELKIKSDGQSPLKVTLVWTDPPGPQLAPALNPRTPVLVNDLDLVVIGPDGSSHLPWVLNVNDPQALATRGDNVVDNVEQVWIPQTVAGDYTIRISHKKPTLENDFQLFSVVANSKSLASRVNTLFWRGGSGSWNDPEKWSETATGESAGRIPTSTDIVRFANSSFTGNNNVVTLTEGAECLDFVYDSDSLAVFNFAKTPLMVNGSFFVQKPIRFDNRGQVEFKGSTFRVNGISATNRDLREVDFRFSSGQSIYELEDSLRVGSIVVEDGLLDLSNRVVFAEEIVLGGLGKAVGLNIRNSTIHLSSDIKADSDDTEVFIAANSRVFFRGGSGYRIDMPEIPLNEVVVEDGPVVLSDKTLIRKFTLQDNLRLEFEGDALFDSLILNLRPEVIFPASAEIATSFIDLQAQSDRRAKFTGVAGSPAQLNLLRIQRFCFDFLDVSNVMAIGEGSINAGMNGTLSGVTDGWYALPCSDVLFADFLIQNACLNGETAFINQSSGSPESFTWTIRNSEGGVLATLSGSNPKFQFSQQGDYSVELLIKAGAAQKRNIRSFQVAENPLTSLVVFKDGNDLAASLPNLNYQWKKNGQAIQGANNRFLTPTGAGEYRVLADNGTCSFLSPIYIVEDQVVGLEDEFLRNGIIVFPNPAESFIRLSISNTYLGEMRFDLLSASGMKIAEQQIRKSEERVEVEMNVANLPSGFFILSTEINGQRISKKVLKQ